MAPTTIQAPLTRDFVLKKCTFFRDVNLWPRTELLSPERWLKNFTEDETPLALHLLNAFQFFSEDLTRAMFDAALHAISGDLVTKHGPASQSVWRSFIDQVLVAPVEGEDPNPTDSGYGFARRARQYIDEKRIGRPMEIVARLISTDAPVVFVDDFVGSGNQFIETWERQYSAGTTTVSLQNIAKVRNGPFYYCPLICTEYGADRIRKRCPEVRLLPAHLIAARDGALSPDSRLWPTGLHSNAVEFIHRASQRAGIPLVGKDRWDGYHGLGLALAFAHSVPDATLPLFDWEKNGWHPLIRRT